MAKSTVPVNFKDDIMNSAMGGKRRYRMINNSDGTISLEDVTTYDQVGSNFGAAQMNATNKAVNAAADASKIIDDIDAIRALTQEGYMAGALALKQVDDSLEKLSSNSSWTYLGNQSTSTIIIPECNEIMIVAYDNVYVKHIRGKCVYEYFLILNGSLKLEMPCSNTDRNIWNVDLATNILSFESSSSTYHNYEVYYR